MRNRLPKEVVCLNYGRQLIKKNHVPLSIEFNFSFSYFGWVRVLLLFFLVGWLVSWFVGFDFFGRVGWDRMFLVWFFLLPIGTASRQPFKSCLLVYGLSPSLLYTSHPILTKAFLHLIFLKKTNK